MAAAGVRLHPACRVRQEKFGLLFYDSRGPRLLFAQTGKLLAPDFFDSVRSKQDLPSGLSLREQKVVQNFMTQLLERGYLREQPLC